jgi:phosphoserine phosphatase RsbU/P
MNPSGPTGPFDFASLTAEQSAALLGDVHTDNWQPRLDYIVAAMREVSTLTDPQQMVRYYAQKMSPALKADRMVAVSRRNLPAPAYRITRSTLFKDVIDPWRQPDRLPQFTSGLLGELVYGDRPRYVADFHPDPADPAFEFLKGMRSFIAVPQYDGGRALNMIVQMWETPNGIDPRRLPEIVWNANLFGRATQNLVLSRQLAEAYDRIDGELRTVADIQRSLLPPTLPTTPGLTWASHYQTSKNAGGDYYDFFELSGGRLGILIADVSGHGTPAAVLMAILHAVAHLHPGEPEHPARVLTWLNSELCRRYAGSSGVTTMFVTAFYAVYDPATGVLRYSSAGHNPPRLRVGFSGDDGPVLALEHAQGLPMGIMDDAEYIEAQTELTSGDAVVFYTDGITETFGPGRELFGTERLDGVIAQPHRSAGAFLSGIMEAVNGFADGAAPADDRTILIAAVD